MAISTNCYPSTVWQINTIMVFKILVHWNGKVNTEENKKGNIMKGSPETEHMQRSYFNPRSPLKRILKVAGLYLRSWKIIASNSWQYWARGSNSAASYILNYNILNSRIRCLALFFCCWATQYKFQNYGTRGKYALWSHCKKNKCCHWVTTGGKIMFWFCFNFDILILFNFYLTKYCGFDRWLRGPEIILLKQV